MGKKNITVNNAAVSNGFQDVKKGINGGIFILIAVLYLVNGMMTILFSFGPSTLIEYIPRMLGCLVIAACLNRKKRNYDLMAGIFILGIIGVAVFWGWVLRWLYTDGRITFSHMLVVWLMASGTVMGGASYYLALRGVTDTLETLAHYVMVETVAGSAGYLAKSTMENVMGRKTPPPGQDT